MALGVVVGLVPPALAAQPPEEITPERRAQLEQRAGALNAEAVRLHQQGRYAAAVPLLEQALRILEQLYPKDKYPQGHPHLAASLNNLGLLLHGQGEYSRALPFLQQALDMYQALAYLYADAASEAEALNYLASLPLTRDLLLSLPPDRLPRTTADDLYAPLWRGKAVLARIAERRHQALLAARDPRAREVWDKLQAARRHLARLLLAPAGTANVTPERLEEATARKEQLERRLAKILPTFDPRPGHTPAHTQLRDRLPEGTVFMDLYYYVRFAQDPEVRGKKGEHRTASYVGFVLRLGQAVQRVDLGPAAPIDEAIADWRQAIAGGKDSLAAEVLRRRVWEPLARHVPADTRTVYLCPDGALTRLPWAALPGSTAERVLLEDHALALVPHGPFLLERLSRQHQPARDVGLLVLGGVAYDEVPTAIAGIQDHQLLLRAAERGKGGKWSELPGTLQELEQVSALAGDRPQRRLQGKDVSTAALLDALPRARWVHLATHGFFADPALRSALQVDEKQFDRMFRDRATPGARNPLVLSGLVLAGANRPPPKDAEALLGYDGGILTAEAIAGLPLEHLELAVLSACDTGLGEVAGGEGVFGLQRAFHLAGTRDVVASLWKVDDQATAALMALFYHKLWKEGQEPLVALHESQLTLYRHPERIEALAHERGLKLDKVAALPATDPTPKTAPVKGRAPVKQWAAFVLSGPGRPAPAR
jgi:CHAT domain-containing protein